MIERVEREILGIDLVGISSANIIVMARTVPFRPVRLVLPHDVTSRFLITDFKCGRNSQLVSVGAIPAIVFSEKAKFTGKSLE